MSTAFYRSFNISELQFLIWTLKKISRFLVDFRGIMAFQTIKLVVEIASAGGWQFLLHPWLEMALNPTVTLPKDMPRPGAACVQWLDSGGHGGKKLSLLSLIQGNSEEPSSSRAPHRIRWWRFKFFHCSILHPSPFTDVDPEGCSTQKPPAHKSLSVCFLGNPNINTGLAEKDHRISRKANKPSVENVF